MADVRLDMGEPMHGWMSIAVRIGADEWAARASYVVDSVADLVYAALELAELRPARPIILLEEPAAYRMSFLDEGARVRVTITRHPDLATAQHDRRGTLAMTASVERMAIARAIWSAMRRLEGAIGRAQIESGWQRPFPASEIAQLGQRLGT